MRTQLVTNCGLETLVGRKFVHAVQYRPLQPVRGSSGLRTTLASVTTAEDGLVAVVVVHAGHSSAEAATDLAREQVLGAAPTGCMTALGRVELALIDQGGARTPVN